MLRGRTRPRKQTICSDHQSEAVNLKLLCNVLGRIGTQIQISEQVMVPWAWQAGISRYNTHCTKVFFSFKYIHILGGRLNSAIKRRDHRIARDQDLIGSEVKWEK